MKCWMVDSVGKDGSTGGQSNTCKKIDVLIKKAVVGTTILELGFNVDLKDR